MMALLLVAGQGCPTEPTKSSPPTAPKLDTAPTTTTMSPPESTMAIPTASADVTLEATALGDNEVQFKWTNGADMGEEDRFVLVRDEDPDPVHDGKNYWWKQYYTVRDVVWRNLPTGTMHFRLCVFKKDQCEEYSNDVEVEIE